MISRLKGILLTRDEGRVEIETASGVVYEVDVPLTVVKRLPKPGEDVEVRTLQVVREDSVALYGFIVEGERELFRRLMTVSGVGARLALTIMSAFDAPRLTRILVEKDVNALRQISGVGKKTAERLAIELVDKVTDLAVAAGGEVEGEDVGAAHAAVSALVSLGYSFTDADKAIREVIEKEEVRATDELVRRALATRAAS